MFGIFLFLFGRSRVRYRRGRGINSGDHRSDEPGQVERLEFRLA
jgi:hypothetical protein